MKFIPRFKGFKYQIEYTYCGERYITNINANTESEALKRLNRRLPYSLRVESVTCFIK